MHQYRIPIPRGNVAFNRKEAIVIARQFGPDYTNGWAIKAQVLVSGRSNGNFKENGLQSGIHHVDNIEQAADLAEGMCGKHFVYTERTGPDGFMCDCVFIVERLDIAKEIFLCITYDANSQCPVIYYSKHGGENITKQQTIYKEDLFEI